jgi:hypothetical protein
VIHQIVWAVESALLEKFREDDYFNTPEDVRMGFSILKSNDFVPEEVERLKEIAEIREKLRTAPDGDEKVTLEKTLRDKTLELSLVLERNKRKK